MKHMDNWKMKDILILQIIFWLVVANGIIWMNLLDGWKGIVWIFGILIH